MNIFNTHHTFSSIKNELSSLAEAAHTEIDEINTSEGQFDDHYDMEQAVSATVAELSTSGALLTLPTPTVAPIGSTDEEPAAEIDPSDEEEDLHEI